MVKWRTVRWPAALLGVVLVGCQAHFVDERPASERAAAAAGLFDLGGVDFAETDAGALLAGGVFAGRDGHLGVGGVSLFARDDGLTELRFDDHFACSDVPGPVVVLTTRDALGTQLAPARGDLALGPLIATSGAQRYLVPGGDGGRREVFIFCKPYGLEVAAAQLEGP
jgi:hypothetical protein